MKTRLSLIAFSVAACFSQAADILYTKHQDEDSFKRISEHLTGKENPGRYTIIRSEPNQRNGYYVALKLGDTDQPPGKSTLSILKETRSSARRVSFGHRNPSKGLVSKRAYEMD